MSYRVISYRVQTTSKGGNTCHTYQSARTALTVYNNIRNLLRRLGYTIADAGNGHNSRAELWIKEGRADRNIEIYAI